VVEVTGRLRPFLPAIGLGVGVAVLIAGAAAAWMIVWPWVIARACVDRAAALGIALTIDSAAPGGTGIRLGGLLGRTAPPTGLAFTVAEADVELSGWRAARVVARQADIAIQGSIFALGAALDPRGQPARTASPEPSLTIESATLEWQADPATAVNADHLRVDVAWAGVAPTVRADTPHLSARIQGALWGPFRANLEQDDKQWRGRLSLDPAANAPTSLLVLGAGSEVTAVALTLARSTLGRLGIPFDIGAAGGRSAEVEGSASYSKLAPNRAEIQAKGTLFGVLLPGLVAPVDLVFDLFAAGRPGQALTIEQGHLAVGPLSGPLRGTLEALDGGLLAAVTWQAAPVPCAAIDKLAAGLLPEVVRQIRALAETAAGVDPLAGTLAAHGSLSLDSRSLGATRIAVVPDLRCRLRVP
jgi:hypothetical protein